MKVKTLARIALVLMIALCMLFVSCRSKKQQTQETTQTPTENTTENRVENPIETTDETTDETTSQDSSDCTHGKTVVENKKEATCKEEGYTGDTVCSYCGEVVKKGEKIALADHSWSEKVLKDATCLQEGEKLCTCTVCDKEETQKIEKTGCVYDYKYESDSVHAGACKHCHTHKSAPHTQGKLVESVNATCEEGAYSLYTCTDCGNEYKDYDESKPALEHSFDKENPVIVPASCASAGEQYYVCKNEGCDAKTEAIVLSATPNLHVFTRIVSEMPATCSSYGEIVYGCEHCKATQTKQTAMISHDYKEDSRDGDWVYSTCKNCNHTVSFLDAKGSDAVTLHTDKLAGDRAFNVNLKEAEIEFPAYLVEQMKDASNVQIGAGKIDEGAKSAIISAGAGIGEEDKEILSSDRSNIYDFTVGGTKMDYYGANIKITLPYTLGENEDPDGIVIWYVNDSLGELESVENVIFTDEDGDGEGVITFEVQHFSFYAVAYKETPEMRCKRGLHDYSNEDLCKTVEPTCRMFGYTYKECKVCGNTSLSNIKDNLDHVYGEKQQPDVNCERGGYVYSRCKLCSDTKTYEYVPATGHTVSGHASCEKGVACTVCYSIVVPAYGHEWSDWETVTQPTATEKGERTRGCRRCGTTEEQDIAPTGIIEAWDADSYEDFVDLLINDVLNLSSGKITYEIVRGEMKVSILMEVQENTGSRLAKITAKQTYGEEEQEFVYYYDNGKLFCNDFASNLENAAPLSFENVKEIVGNAIATNDPDVVKTFEITQKLLDKLVSDNNEELNAFLEDSGVDMTAEELRDAAKAMQTAYAYLVYKLGFATNVPMSEDDIPTVEELHDELSKFMTATKKGNNTTYTYDLGEYFKAFEALIEWAEVRLDKSLAEVLYDRFGNTITAIYPELTDWSKLSAHIRKEFGGTVKVKTAVDKLINIVESADVCTVEEFYDVLEKAIGFYTGAQIDVGEIISEYSEKTLDEVLQITSDDEEANMSDLFDMLDSIMTESKFGDMVVDTMHDYEENEFGDWVPVYIDVTLGERIEEIKQNLDKVSFKGKVSFTLDASGKLVDVDCNQNTEISEDENTANVGYIIKVEQDSSVKVTIPKEYKDLDKIEVEIKEDEKGNIHITGLPEDAEITVSLGGQTHSSLADKVEKVDPNDIIAKLYGYDVYMLKEEFWSEEARVGDFAMSSNGKLYKLNDEYSSGSKITAKALLSDVLKNPDAYLPKADAETDCCFIGDDGTRINIYKTVIGLVCQIDGEWYIINNDYCECDYTWDEEIDKQWTVYRDVEYAPYTETVKSFKISILTSDYHYYDTLECDGELIKNIGRVHFSTSAFNNTVYANFVMIGSDIYLVSIEDYSYNFYVLGEETEVEYSDMYEYENEYVCDSKGTVLEGYTVVSLYKKIPSYYAQYDGCFFPISSNKDLIFYNKKDAFVKIDVSEYDKVTLDDGRIFFVVGEQGDITADGIAYGYFHVQGGWYVQAACTFAGGELSNVVYRANTNSNSIASASKRIDGEDFVSILNEGLKKNADGSYTVDKATVEALRANLNYDWDVLALTVSGEYGEVYLSYNYNIGVIIPEEIYLNGYYYAETEHYDWAYYFGYSDGSDYPDGSLNYDVQTNENGDLEITLKDDSVIDVEFDADIDEDSSVENALKYNEEKSNELGVDIYDAIRTEKHTDWYVYFGGRYYYDYYDYKTYITEYEELTAKQIFVNYNVISDAYYRYDTLQGNERVYDFGIGFNEKYNETRWIDLYMQIVDGKICILKGVDFDTSVAIKYEDIVPMQQYLASLTLVEMDSYKMDSWFLESGAPIYKTRFEIYDGDYYLGDVDYMYYYKNGRKQYIYATEYDSKEIVTFDCPATLPQGWVEISREDRTDGFRSYAFVRGFYYETTVNEYVKIGDKFVDYDTYNYTKRSYEDFLYQMADRDYVIAAETPNGMRYFTEYEWRYDNTVNDYVIEVYDEVFVSDAADFILEEAIGQTSEGYTAYSAVMITIDNLDVYTLSDGSKVYCYNGWTDGYKEMDDGYYIYGYVEKQSDGSYRFIPDNYWSWVDFNDIAGKLRLRDYITLDGNRAVISKDILEILEDYSDDLYIYVCDESNWNSWTVSYAEFASWFKK
ncbi:MAG: hypothetical protein E7592_03115 [Ruminococcaceae bacterium]|nr:hypothetical protein [Oscillospiraceae bacterium]